MHECGWVRSDVLDLTAVAHADAMIALAVVRAATNVRSLSANGLAVPNARSRADAENRPS